MFRKRGLIFRLDGLGGMTDLCVCLYATLSESALMMEETLPGRILLNPAVDNAFYYANLKAITLLFDEVIVWAPMEKYWEAAQYDDRDLRAAFTAKPGERPLLIPGGRDRVFDLSQEMPHGKKDFRLCLKTQAEQSNTVLKMADTDRYYAYVNDIRREKVWRRHIHEIAEYFLNGEDPRSPEILAKLSWSLEEARRSYPKLDMHDVFVANWLMDTGACAELDRGNPEANTSPLVNDHQIDGYKLLQTAILEQSNLARTIQNTHADRSPLLDSRKDARKERKVIESVANLFQINKLPWKEIRKIKAAVGPDIRAYYGLRHFYDGEDLVALASRIDRRLFLIDATEAVAKEAVAAGHTALSHRLPDFARYYEAISEARKAAHSYKNENNPTDKLIRAAPWFTEWAVCSTVGVDSSAGKVALAASQFALSLLKLDEKLTRLLLKPAFSISSISRVAFEANRARAWAFRDDKPVLT